MFLRSEILIIDPFTSVFTSKKQETFLLGGFNTDVACSNSTPLLTKYDNFKRLFSLRQLIVEPTQILSSKTLASDVDKISQSDVINIGLSDHNLILCTRKVAKKHISSRGVTQIRCITLYSAVTFCLELDKVDLFKVIICENVNNAWCIFKSLFLDVLDKIAPVNQDRLKA